MFATAQHWPMLRVAAQPDLQFTRFVTLDALIEKLEENIACFDAIVVEQSVFEEASVSALNKLKQYLPLISSVVLTLEKSDFSALSYLERGFSDCVTADSAASTSLLTRFENPLCVDVERSCDRLANSKLGRTSAIDAHRFATRRIVGGTFGSLPNDH